ncbi:MAG TPA: cupin domain-containing protein [Candidatus Hydrogenedentes bacterium]|nr:cupin domain-containing protein [Candidatus Hydrogenedentota bacterium]
MGETARDIYCEAVNETHVDSNWYRRGFTCERRCDRPGQTWSDYAHDVDELVMLVEGEIEVEMKGKIHKLRPGQELLVPASVPHTIRNVGSTHAVWLKGMAMDHAYTD